MKHVSTNVIITKGVDNYMKKDASNTNEIMISMFRFAMGDWGDLTSDDEAMNNDAIKNAPNENELADRIVAKYNLKNNESIYIITEWDLSATTILFTWEY